MKQNLGLICDPIDGPAQIPYIDRNMMGVIKAIDVVYLGCIDLEASGQLQGKTN